MKVPRWLELQFEIDYLYFVLGEIHKKLPRLPLDVMIDEATGHEAAMFQEIKEICMRMKKLKKEWNEVTGECVSTRDEDELIESVSRCGGIRQTQGT